MSSNALYENAAASLTTSWPAGTVTDPAPPNVTGTAPVAMAAPSPCLAIVVVANVTGTVPKRFERCTRTRDPPNDGVRIARTDALLTVLLMSPDGLKMSLMSVPGEASLGTPAQAATHCAGGHVAAPEAPAGAASAHATAVITNAVR